MLNFENIGPVLVQMAGVGMSEGMRSHFLIDLSFQFNPFDCSLDFSNAVLKVFLGSWFRSNSEIEKIFSFSLAHELLEFH